MMRNRNLLLSCPAIVFADIACFSSAFSLFVSADGKEFAAPFMPEWIICAGICFSVQLYLFNRAYDSSAIVRSCILFFFIQCVLTYIRLGFIAGFLGVFLTLCTWCLSYYRIYSAFVNGIKPEQLLDLFDGCAVMLFIIAIVVSVQGYSPLNLLPLILALVLLLSALISVRASSVPGRAVAGFRGSLFIIIAVAAAIVTAFVAVKFGGTGIKSAVTFLVRMVRNVLAFLLSLIRRIIEFLASLLPEKEYEELLYELPADTLPAGELQDYEFSSDIPIIAIIAFLAAVLVGAIVYRLLHSIKLNRVRFSGITAGKRKKISGKGRIKALISALKSKLDYFFCRVFQRNSARGMFAELNAVFAHKGQGRKGNESCRDFIARVSLSLPNCEAELTLLADALDTELFGGITSAYSVAQAAALRKKIRHPEKQEAAR